MNSSWGVMDVLLVDWVGGKWLGLAARRATRQVILGYTVLSPSPDLVGGDGLRDPNSVSVLEVHLEMDERATPVQHAPRGDHVASLGRGEKLHGERGGHPAQLLRKRRARPSCGHSHDVDQGGERTAVHHLADRDVG